MADRDAWTDALTGIPHAFQHSAEFAHAMQITSGHETFLYSFRDGDTRLACPLIERGSLGFVDVATPSGLAGFVGNGSWECCAEDWQALANARGWVTSYVGLHPAFEPPGLERYARANDNSIYVLEIERGREELLRRADSNRRRELRGWEARAESLVHDRTAISAFLVSNYERFMRSVDARDPYLSAQTLGLLCHSETCIVVGTGSPSDLESAYLFGTSPYGGESLINVSSTRGRARRCPAT